jgi:hypothetical protein
MKRHNMTALLLALALTLAVPGAALARAEVVGASGLGCCADLGVRLSLSLDGTSIRGSVVFPGVETGMRSTGSSEPAELIGFAVDTADVVIWGIPIIRAIAQMAINGLEMRATREARI